jgi:hypothetical protein
MFSYSGVNTASEEIIVTRHGNPTRRNVPEGGAALEQVRRIVEHLRSLRRKMAARPDFTPLTDREIRTATHEGRR